MTAEALGVDIYIPVPFASAGVPVNNFATPPTLLSAARNGTAFTPSSTTVSANGVSSQSYGYTLQGSETALQGAGLYTLVFQCLDAASDYPTLMVELDIGQGWLTTITTLANRIGAFTGSGVNTVLGFLKAVLSKTASTPSDIGGTFDASTDSTEAIRDRGDAAWITGVGTSAATIADAVWDETLSGHTTAGSTGATLSNINTRANYISSGNVNSINPYDARTRTLYLTVYDDYTETGILIEDITVERLLDLTDADSMEFGFLASGREVAADDDTFAIEMSDVTASSITLRPTQDYTNRLRAAHGRAYKIRAVKDGKNITVLSGLLSISGKILP